MARVQSLTVENFELFHYPIFFNVLPVKPIIDPFGKIFSLYHTVWQISGIVW